MLHPSIHTLSIGLPKEMNSQLVDQSIVTGIQKQPVKAVDLTYDGFEGDGVGNTKNHGAEIVPLVFIRLNTIRCGRKNLTFPLQPQLLAKM
ncbi:hypothetical protein JCM19037_2891 [Geomicrobium sp. JCM 19037]|uniref:hypothetical protein n=1 Tax=Geomicrobium sp. JCM 19037 TaxID=1460634 RepID=UPI00045F18F5|nr:hypothetical protein [Geomicrobium sp. JCM 19037]GAK04470.1 hypothetical protein JCM19037_2891 [Geomicrobium sp. JCM 19037]